MKFTGKLRQPVFDYITGRLVLLFEPNEDFREAYEELKGCDKLSLEIRKYRVKRSLDANAYFHVLVGKLADAMRISKPRCKNIMLYRYGQPYLLDDETQAVIKSNIKVSQMLEQEEIHCYPCGSKEENGMELTFYKVYRGSHTFDTREMSILIDGVVEECKGLGIETMTPAQLHEMKEKWGIDIG